MSNTLELFEIRMTDKTGSSQETVCYCPDEKVAEFLSGFLAEQEDPLKGVLRGMLGLTGDEDQFDVEHVEMIAEVDIGIRDY